MQPCRSHLCLCIKLPVNDWVGMMIIDRRCHPPKGRLARQYCWHNASAYSLANQGDLLAVCQLTRLHEAASDTHPLGYAITCVDWSNLARHQVGYLKLWRRQRSGLSQQLVTRYQVTRKGEIIRSVTLTGEKTLHPKASAVDLCQSLCELAARLGLE